MLGFERAADELARIDHELSRAVGTAVPMLNDAAGHYQRAGGKRLRPLLTVATGALISQLTGHRDAGSEVSHNTVMGGVSVELVHLGSLYHDDVMDDATVRRQVESANAKWGNLVAILAGDYLLARASEIGASLGTDVAGLLARTIGRLCEGQVLELQYAFNADRPIDSYIQSISGKTASLMSTACEIGAIVNQAYPEHREAAIAFGEAFGMSFQIRDDILDIIGTEAALGKPAGHDLEEGVYTLPVLYALDDPSVGPELRSLLGGPIDAPTRDKALGLVRQSNGIALALDDATRFATTADTQLRLLGQLDEVPGLPGFARDLLADVSV